MTRISYKVLTAKHLENLRVFSDEAFSSMQIEWFIGGFCQGGGNRTQGSRAGVEWGKSWQDRLEEVQKAEKECGIWPERKWWDKKLGERNAKRAPLTRRVVLNMKRVTCNGWSIPMGSEEEEE